MNPSELPPLELIALIAEGSGTVNSLPNIAKIARDALANPAPIDVVIYCPSCGTQHVDGTELASSAVQDMPGKHKVDIARDNPPHRSHLCHHCNWTWRTADVPTNGVANLQTRGKKDGTCQFLELDKLAWGSLKKAAVESKWIPQDHCFMNDWINDVEKFLRDGPVEIKRADLWETLKSRVPALDPVLREAVVGAVLALIDQKTTPQSTVSAKQPPEDPLADCPF